MSSLLEEWMLKRAAMSPEERQFAALSTEAMLEGIGQCVEDVNDLRAALNANVETAFKLGIPHDVIFTALDDALKLFDTLSEQDVAD